MEKHEIKSVHKQADLKYKAKKNSEMLELLEENETIKAQTQLGITPGRKKLGLTFP